MHKVNGFHRDIKPDNLLIAKDKEQDGEILIKLADFGLARTPVATDMPMTYNPWGTRGYIAPEVLMGAEYNHKSDIYSLGIVGIELFTGTKEPDKLQLSIPKALRRLLKKMTAMSQAERPNITEIATILTELLDTGQAPQNRDVMPVAVPVPQNPPAGTQFPQHQAPAHSGGGNGGGWRGIVSWNPGSAGFVCIGQR